MTTFLQRNLFKILVLAASIGICNAAFAQAGSGLPIKVMDDTLRTMTPVQFSYNADGVLSSSIAVASTPVTLVGRHGFVAVSATSFGTGITITTSIAEIEMANRLMFDLVSDGSDGSQSQLRCDKLSVDGIDWAGREISQYTFLQLTSGAVHTASVAFRRVTKIRLNNCYRGDNCPGASCTSSAPQATDQLRVFTSRYYSPPFRITNQTDLLMVCRQTMPISLTVPTGDVCFPGDVGFVTANVAGTCTNASRAGCAFAVNAEKNTILFPKTTHSVPTSKSVTTFTNSFLDDDKVWLRFKASKN